MLSRCLNIACGQGATKAMIQAIKESTISKENCMIVNSTSKDIPNEYQDISIIISDDPDAGCGKVREAATYLMKEYLKYNSEVIKNNIRDDIDFVNIMTTTEGASGSGASVVLAKYIKQVIKVPVNIILITGFESDARGLQNTINYFKDLNGAEYTIRIVSNKKYLERNVTTFAAEEMANHEIANILSIIQGQYITSSDHNIDTTDHYRILSNPGLMFTGEVNIENRKYKNTDQSNKDLSDMIDYSSSLDFTPSATRIGIYMNISDSNLESIDTTFEVLKKKLCGQESVPELFIHRQNNSMTDQFIRVIATGIELPKEEVNEMYKKYQSSTKAMNNRESDFFESLDKMETSKIKDTSPKSNYDSEEDFLNDNNNEDMSEEVSMVFNRSKRKMTTSRSNTNNEVKSSPVNNIPTNNIKNNTSKKSNSVGTHKHDKQEHIQDNISDNY